MRRQREIVAMFAGDDQAPESVVIEVEYEPDKFVEFEAEKFETAEARDFGGAEVSVVVAVIANDLPAGIQPGKIRVSGLYGSGWQTRPPAAVRER